MRTAGPPAVPLFGGRDGAGENLVRTRRVGIERKHPQSPRFCPWQTLTRFAITWYAPGMDMTSMNISIPESLRAFVEKQVHDHGYNSASEYVRELIRDARDQTTKETELRELVQLGLEQLRRGQSLELDEATLPRFFDEMKTRARDRLSKKKKRRE